MSSRKRRAIGSAVVDESKKAKQDSPSEKTIEEIPHEPEIQTCEAVTSDPDDIKYIQIIITGPRKCGKSSLVLSYMGQPFPPRQAEFLSKQYLHICPNNKPVMIWDLDARHEFTGYREKSYPEADIALLCFDIKKPMTEGNRRKKFKERLEKDDLKNLLHPWYNELVRHRKDIPIILVGLKGDLKVNSNGIFSEEERKYAMDRFPNIEFYEEVSAFMNKKGVEDLFRKAIGSVHLPIRKEMFANCGFEFLGNSWSV